MIWTNFWEVTMNILYIQLLACHSNVISNTERYEPPNKFHQIFIQPLAHRSNVIWVRFLGRWLQICHRISKFQSSGSKMTNRNFKNPWIFVQIDIWGYLGLLITNMSSGSRNSKWWVQDNGKKTSKYINFYWYRWISKIYF